VQERERGEAIASERAILVRLVRPDETIDALDPLDELSGLATTAGAVVVSGMIQRRDKPDAATYLGSGKVKELAELVQYHDADIVIFDNDLSPGQTRNLEKATEAKVVDRTELILDIFATHAQTYESRLAVELAQLEYSLPRLKQMWTHLSRIKMGVGMRGPGEKQLETDRRLVEKRISELRDELRQVEQRKERQVAGRRGFMTVSLVGYTNAGKSTLMNRLTNAGVRAEDKLFATLDTRTRRWQLPSWGPVLLSDTVGFIRNLPHRLVASFKATLEETRQADLLLHVADASSPEVFTQISAVFTVLEELGIEEKDALIVLNKIDALENRLAIQRIQRRYPRAIPISAKTGEGFDELAAAVSDALSETFHELKIDMSVSNGKLMAYLAAHGEILNRDYHDERVTIHCRLPQKYFGRIHDADVKITDLTESPTTKAASANSNSNGKSKSDSKVESVFAEYDPALLKSRGEDHADDVLEKKESRNESSDFADTTDKNGDVDDVA
jgi:GTP-binding protein HflX